MCLLKRGTVVYNGLVGHSCADTSDLKSVCVCGVRGAVEVDTNWRADISKVMLNM